MENEFFSFIAADWSGAEQKVTIERSQIFVVNEENIVTHRVNYSYLDGPQLMKVLRKLLANEDRPK